MIVLELTKFNDASGAMTNYTPFTYQSLPGAHTTADYWINVFGCPDETVVTFLYVSAFLQSYLLFYDRMISLSDCIDQETSFYFIISSEILYAHLSHDANKWSDAFEYGDQLSYNDKKDIYIDNVYCASLLKSVPSIAKQQDIVNYKKLATKPGVAVLNNISDPFTKGGKLDDYINRKLYGNDAYIYYLELIAGVNDYSRDDLQDLSTYIIEDYDISMQEVAVRLQDKRVSQDIDIPFTFYNADDYPDIDEKYIGKVIPFMLGLIRASEAIPVNSDDTSEDVEYRQALILTDLGTVQVKVDEKWVTVATVTVNLSNGSFTVDIGDSRNDQDVPYECRVLNSTGIANTYASDCIKELNNRFINIEYIASNYDQTEWEIEEKSLSTIGILFNKQVKLFEAIRQIQAGANVGFRYEIKADGRRTIRIDDNDRSVVSHIVKEDINNINILPVKSRKDLLASVVKVNYAHDYFDDVDYYVENDDNEETVLRDFRQQRKLITIETALTTESDANDRASWYAERYIDVPKIVTLELRGNSFYNVRIYDIHTVEITSAFVDVTDYSIIEGREFYGFWKVKILSVDPKFGRLINIVTALLIEKCESIDS